ncbi:MAG: transposase [Candidatus Synoicihabitans palmerolidicus]|nr:transposase [Candidatus Synoicihabitans palmerolidicus]
MRPVSMRGSGSKDASATLPVSCIGCAWWCGGCARTCAPSPAWARPAPTYLLGQWKPLVAHLQHGETRLDNNLVENAIRPSALGKKNWLFAGHPDAGQRSAIIYSIVISCQRHGHDPLDYLRDVLTRLPQRLPGADISDLLPVNWKPSVDVELPAPSQS